ncbi:MAG: AAA family ATPase, partial [Rhizobiales bacterium]|nr:AAA family ATPase [Hyphomicrobiales bacterium]
MHQPNYFIISGGPGSGKTAIIDKLASRGFTTVAETGRAILREQMEAGGDATHEGDAAAYGAEMLKRGITDYKRMRGADEPVFFDRGIAELVGYFRLKGLPVPPEVASAGHEYRSNRLVFLAPPWQAIYRQDAERAKGKVDKPVVMIAMPASDPHKIVSCQPAIPSLIGNIGIGVSSTQRVKQEEDHHTAKRCIRDRPAR